MIMDTEDTVTINQQTMDDALLSQAAQVEKLLCAALDVPWVENGPSAESLVKGLAENTKRLNFLIQYGARISWSMDSEVCNVWLPADRGEDARPAEGYPQKSYYDARQAIDAARVHLKAK
jgi:hypothetical protein